MLALEARLRAVIEENSDPISPDEIISQHRREVSIDKSPRWGQTKRPLLLAAAVVVAATIGVVAWRSVSNNAAGPTVRISEQPPTPAPPVAHDGWDPNIPRAIQGNDAPKDKPDVDVVLPDRLAVPGADGNWAGYADRVVLRAHPNYAATPDNPGTATSAYFHEFIPVTKDADPASHLVGYLLRGYGFVDLSTIEAPDFNVDEFVAQADAQAVGRHPSRDQASDDACIGATPPNAAVDGCVFDRDLKPAPGQPDPAADQPVRGTPVYDTVTKSRVIGYLTDTGFIPTELASRYDDIKACNVEFSRALSEGRSPAPTPNCRDLFLEQDVSTEVLSPTGHRPNTGTATTP